MTVIFIMSSQSAVQSSQLSGGIVADIIDTFFEKFEVLSAEQQQYLTYAITFIVRKAAHFFEYFLLGILSGAVALTYTDYRLKLRMLIAFSFCTLYAVSDEVHQYFVPGRACRIFDICIDTLGIMAAIILLSWIATRQKDKLGEYDA